MSQDNKSDVLIVGAGPTGLYAALLLTEMGCSVNIIDKKSANAPATNPTYLWSPRSLQLLQTFDLVSPLLEHGVRHWGLETYTNKGSGNAATTASHHKHAVWENEATEFNYSLSCESGHVCRVISDALDQRHGVRVAYDHTLVDLENEGETCVATVLHDAMTSFHRARIVLGADGTHSFVRQKLGIAYERRKSSSVFYTVEATLTTNFRAARAMAALSKGRHSLFYVGHRDNKAYISFEHKPAWSKLTIDDDVPLSMAQKHIKSVMEPFQIDFSKVHSYRRWTATERMCEEFSVDRRYFLAGGAAQSVCPEGIVSSDLGLEQVKNICWKLCLCLKHRGSPELLDTYDDECRSKLQDTLHASRALMHLFSHNTPAAGLGLNSTPSRELVYILNRNKHGFIGEAPYHANLLNIDTASTLSIATTDTSDLQAVTAALSQRAQSKIVPGTPGTLAPNSKLKPYTLFTLLVTVKELPLSTTASLANSKPTLDKDDRPPRSRRWSRTRSNSTSSTSSGSTTSWLLAPIKKRSSNPPVVVNSTTPTTAERWRKIRQNQYSLLDRMAQNASPSAFRVIVFCQSLADPENIATLQRFRRHLEEAHSFVQRYEKLTASHPLLSAAWMFEENKRSSTMSLSSMSRSSISSNRVFYSPPTSPVSTTRTSLDQPRSTSSFDFRPPDIITTGSAMFNFTYITHSSKTEIIKFLGDTKPASVHATFPLGLDKVYLDHDHQSHTLYNIQVPSVVIVRPDGYIGTALSLTDPNFEKLDAYFDAFLRPPIDLTSAAAIAADYYDL